MELIPDEVVAKYVADPFHCPACSSRDIVAQGDFTGDGQFVWQTVDCESCGEQWLESYAIQSIESTGFALPLPEKQ